MKPQPLRYPLRPMRRPALFLFALALAGCERGCLTKYFAEQRGEGATNGESIGEPARTRPPDLGGTDCSDGLLRCQHGHVEASRVAHLSARCGEGQSPEKKASECVCPWDVVASCECAAEGLEAIGPADGGARQLCRPEQPVARPVLREDDASVRVCTDDGVSCRDSFVHICDAPAAPERAVAYCIFGCAPFVQLADIDDGPPKNPDGVISILCNRGDAERR